MSLRDRAYIYASTYVLTEGFPEDVHTWDNDKIAEYCEDHAWEPFQYWDGDVIHAHIEDVANDLIRFAQTEFSLRGLVL